MATPPLPVRIVILVTLGLAFVASVLSPQAGLVRVAAPKAVKLLDPAIVAALALLVALRAVHAGSWRVERWRVAWASCLAVILAIGTAGALFNATPPYYAAQAAFFLIRPAALLLLFTAFAWCPDTAGAVWTPVVVYSVANIARVAVQAVPVIRGGGLVSADGVIGLFNDAHAQATFSYGVALLLLGRSLAGLTLWRRVAWAALIGANLLAGFVSQGQKATGVLAGVIVLGVFVQLLRSRRWLRRSLPLATAATAVLALLIMSPARSDLGGKAMTAVTGNLIDVIRLGGYRATAFVNDIGIVRMVREYLDIATGQPAVLAVGLGPSGFGSPAALTRVSKGDAPPRIARLFWWEVTGDQELARMGELRLLGLSAKTSLPGVVLGEYGCLGLAAFLVLVVWPFFIPPPDDREAARRMYWLKMAYLFVVLQSVLNALGSWDNDVVLTVIMAGFASFQARSRPQLEAETWQP